MGRRSDYIWSVIIICESTLSARARLCMKSCPIWLRGLLLPPPGHGLMGSTGCLSNLDLFLPGDGAGSEQMSGLRSASANISQYINCRANPGTLSHPDSIESTYQRRSRAFGRFHRGQLIHCRAAELLKKLPNRWRVLKS